MGRLEKDATAPRSAFAESDKLLTNNFPNEDQVSKADADGGKRPTRRRWIPVWVWFLLPFVAMILGGWWVYQSLVVRNLTFETKTSFRSGASVIEAVRHVNKQIFIEHYEVVDIDYRQAPQNWLALLGVEQSFVLLLRGNVPAGIDARKIASDNIWISPNGKRVQLTLPPPQVFEDNVSIDFQRSRILAVKDTCPDLICDNDVMAYQNQLLPEGRQLLIDDAIENGIYDQVAESAKSYYEQLLKTLGFDEVQVVVTGY